MGYKKASFLTIEKEIYMPDWNLTCLWRITADHMNNDQFVYISNVWKNKKLTFPIKDF